MSYVATDGRWYDGVHTHACKTLPSHSMQRRALIQVMLAGTWRTQVQRVDDLA